jgi:hypothetical protein
MEGLSLQLKLWKQKQYMAQVNQKKIILITQIIIRIISGTIMRRKKVIQEKLQLMLRLTLPTQIIRLTKMYNTKHVSSFIF